MTQRFDRNSSAPWRHRFEKINTLRSHTSPHKDANGLVHMTESLNTEMHVYDVL